MSEFEDHVYNRAREGILSIPDKTAADIYALSFNFWTDGDERSSMLSVGYNTNSRWRACTPGEEEPGFPLASDPDEARWNFAFWLQEQGTACTIGWEDDAATARKEWMDSLGLWFSDEEQQEDSDRTAKLGGEITDKFIDLCARVARRLHADGVVTGKFGRAVPIIVHELEYYDRIAQATKEANPPGLADEFTQWIAAM